MTIQFRSYTLADLAALTVTVNKPAGVAAGDLLLLHVRLTTGSVTPTVPSGFALVTGTAQTASPGFRLYAKVATGSEPADYTVTYASSSARLALIALYSDVGAVLVADGVATLGSQPGATYTWTGVTTTYANTLLMCFASFSTGENPPADTGMTKRYEVGVTGSMFLMTQAVAAIGATGTRAATATTNTASLATVAWAETPPTAPSALTIGTVGVNQIAMDWTDNSGGLASFSIERSPNGSTAWAEVGTVAAGVTTFTNTGLTAATTYYYRVRGALGTIYSTYSNTDSDATLSGLLAPTGVTATAMHPRKIRLRWTDTNADEDGVSIERSPNGSTGWAEVDTVAADVTEFIDTTVSPSTAYYYRLRSYQD